MCGRWIYKHVNEQNLCKIFEGTYENRLLRWQSTFIYTDSSSTYETIIIKNLQDKIFCCIQTLRYSGKPGKTANLRGKRLKHKIHCQTYETDRCPSNCINKNENQHIIYKTVFYSSRLSLYKICLTGSLIHYYCSNGDNDGNAPG